MVDRSTKSNSVGWSASVCDDRASALSDHVALYNFLPTNTKPLGLAIFIDYAALFVQESAQKRKLINIKNFIAAFFWQKHKHD